MDTVAPSPDSAASLAEAHALRVIMSRLGTLDDRLAALYALVDGLASDLAPIIATVRQLQQIPRVAKAIRNADAR